MSKHIANRSVKRAAARRRAIRRKAAAWKRTMRRIAAVSLIAAQVLVGSQAGLAQGLAGVGQGAMAPAGGLVNGAVAGFQNLNANGPGWLYYGANAADRGLGYRGSYMTLGGFIPYAEDDLGGLWSADVRSHLSNYGGFFSNVGAVRKQFIGGTLLGVGVYWDYDGDQNQYSDTTITDDSGSYVFAGGQSYNQVGVSGEWLTDYGNLRSNGYMPVGTTAGLMGPFVGNSILCQNGINAALAGTDLELGVYVPGLSDWAGMVSVGGYAYGNTRYDFPNGQNAVPWFGGVYTRLDLTLIKNWDFSLQYNNDSYFDSTGFARLTYRMGGSRRRNVPDQMEQPMMRNEHIVRAHQAPEQAINPYTLAPWRVIHVDNSATNAPAGNGTAASPYTTLFQAQNAATAAYDIVYVHQGNSINSPYTTDPLLQANGFVFQNEHQYLIGQGSTIAIPTVDCGFLSIARLTGGTTDYPVLSQPGGTAIELAAKDPTVDHLKIVGSQVGISDGTGMPAGSVATVRDVQIAGTGPSQTGVVIQGNETFNFTNMLLTSLTADGFVIDGQNAGGGNPRVNISNSTINNTSGSAVIVNDVIGDGRVRLAGVSIDGTTESGVVVRGGNAIVQASTIKNVGTYGVQVAGGPVVGGVVQTTGTSTVQVVGSTITAQIGVQGSAANTGETLNLTINQNTLSAPAGGNGINLAINGSGTTAGTSGVINANIVGNRISVLPTTAVATGTAGGITSPALVNSDIYLTTSNTATGLTSLTIKASSQDNLVALNNNATVTTNPIFNPINTGTTSPLVPPPPPPNYDPAAVVPVPLQ